MAKEIEVAIEKIIFIPRDLQLIRTKSWNTLVQESGYFQLQDKIKETDISQRLKRYPTLISEWLQFSEDQRCTPAITFSRGESGRYYVDRNPESEQFREFNTLDGYDACAYFIMRNLEKTSLH